MGGSASDAIARAERLTRTWELLTIIEKNPRISQHKAIAKLMLKTGNREETVTSYLKALINDDYVVIENGDAGRFLWTTKAWLEAEKTKAKK